MSAQADLFAPAPDWPEGFDYRPDLIEPEAEARLLAWFAGLPFRPFEFQGYLGKREVVSFGWRYDYDARILRAVDPLPVPLLDLRGKAAAFAGLPPEDLVQALVTRYRPGTTIGWHRDRPDFDTVVGVSLQASAILRFRRQSASGWARRSLEVAPRSAYVLSGPARQDWQHSLRPVDQERFSVTFRSLRPR